ncbi:MAG: right-handed parallel beta-helix repeat-containing protein [Planctomycetota bacterium]|jgi:parallel beta-helix repeat protein
MKKKHLYAVILVLSLLLVGLTAAPAFATPMVTISRTDAVYNPVIGGGEYRISPNQDLIDITAEAGSFLSFCIEPREPIVDDGSVTYLASVGLEAILGDGNFDAPGPLGGDLLDPTTAYLYTEFRNGTLAGYSGDAASAVALQTAIWHLEDETDWTDYDALSPAAQGFVDAVVHTGWTATGNVRVLHLWTEDSLGKTIQARDMLVMVTPEPPVLRNVPQQYPTIQAAINACNDFDIVIIAPGKYSGPGNQDINFNGKPITVRSTDPNDPNIVAATVIDCEGERGFVFHTWETPDSTITGLTITNGNGSLGGAIYCSNNSSPSIINCVFINNSAAFGGAIVCTNTNTSPKITNCTIKGNSALFGGGIYCNGASPNIANSLIIANSAQKGAAVYSDNAGKPVIENCTISQNTASSSAGGIYCYQSSNLTASNTILWGNSKPDIYVYSGSATITYCDIEGGWSGTGNIDADPCFADVDDGDYHLKSQAGRWDVNTQSWVLDDVTSPCIDAGDPWTDYSNEPFPNGVRVNMGAYGNTPEASKKPVDSSETFSVEYTLVETLFCQEAVLNNVAVSGDLNGILDFTNFEIIKITTGSFAGKGFSKGQWQANLEGINYSGNWQGMFFLKEDERRIYMKGTISGEISGIVEGYLAESVPESGIYDQYQATWRIGRLGTFVTSATINLNGSLSYLSTTEFPATELYVLQTDHEGILYGHYSGPLNTVINHVRIADGNNPYNGEGFSIISYVSDSGSGQGWTYDKLVSPGRIELNGFFSNPLFGIASGILYESEVPRTLFLKIERVDLGLPPMVDLEVKTWGPSRVSPGQTVNYLIEYRNDGLKMAEDVEVVMKLPYEVEFTSATSGGVYKQASYDVVWYLGDVLPKSTGNLSAKIRVLWGLPLGTIIDWVVFAPRERMEVEVDPNIAVDYEIVEIHESQLIANVLLDKPNELYSSIQVNISQEEVSEWRAPTFEYLETEEEIEAAIGLTVAGSWNLIMTNIIIPAPIQRLIEWPLDFIDFRNAFDERLDLLDYLFYGDEIGIEDYHTLSKVNLVIFGTRTTISGVAPIIEKEWPDWLPEWKKTLQKHMDSSLPGWDMHVGAYIYRHKVGPLPDDWRTNREFAMQLKELYDNAYKSFLEEKSHDTDSHESEVNVARDPSVKYGPEGHVSLGERLDYRVEYENEGEGIAFGVYFTDTLDEDVNDSTLEIGSVIDVNDGSVISGPGIYNQATRTITWFAGEVGPGESGYADFSVNVRADANDGTEIINYATIYFPSVPEETRTNGIVSIVSLNQPPTADAGADQTVEQESYDGAEVTLDGSGSTDADSTPGTNDDIVSFNWYEADTLLGSGETINYTFPLGAHTVTLVVTDSFGETDEDEVAIVVQDTTPPEFTLSVTPNMLWPPNHKIVQITPSWTVSDNCDDSPTVTLVSITMNEGEETNTYDPQYDNTLGDGHTTDDIQIIDGNIYLRAERSGTGTGRIYTITYQAIDDSGNVTVDSATITVPHDQP